MSATILPFESPSATPLGAEQNRFHMRRIRHHDDDGVGFFRNLLAGFADLAARGNEFRCNGPDVVKKQAMSRGLKMASHRTSHGSQANEANINHFALPYRCPTMWPWFAYACHPRPSVVDVRGLLFATDPAAISDLVEIAKQEGIVDLSGTRFVAAGIIGQLDMGDTRQNIFARFRAIMALHHLHVVNIILNEEIFDPTSEMI